MTEQAHIIAPGAAARLEGFLAEFKPRRVMLVTGKASFEKCGAAETILPLLERLHIEVARFCDFAPNPDTKGLARGMEYIRNTNPDAIIAVGGGSVIDMAKLIRFSYAYPGDIFGDTHTPTASLIPLASLPTTAGTGSEATHFAVLYHNGIKHSIEHEHIRPDIAIVDCTFTYGTPPYLTACAGFDALAQAIEAYWNRNATPESDALALNAINLLYTTLPRLVENQYDDECRAKASEGAYMAGRAIDITKTTAPHAFSYPFTSHYSYPHGHAVALTFPSIAQINMSRPGMPECKRNELKLILGLGEDIASTLSEYTARLGLTPRDMTYDIDLLASEINLTRLANNPADIDAADARHILQTAITNR